MNTRARAKQTRWKPGQPFHAKTGSPLKGPTPKKVFQTTDVGFGPGHFLSHRTQGPKLRSGKQRTYLGIDYRIMDPARHATLERARNLELRIHPAEQAIEEMIARGEKNTTYQHRHAKPNQNARYRGNNLEISTKSLIPQFQNIHCVRGHWIY
jgi:hypothetical protein